VFLSYSLKDEQLARRVTRILEGSGLQVETARLALGADIAGAIRSHILNSTGFVALLTLNSVNSRWLFFELGAAQAAGLPCVAVVHNLPSADLPHMLRTQPVFRLREASKVADALLRARPMSSEDIERERFFSRLATIPGVRALPSIGPWILVKVDRPADMARRINKRLAPGTVSVPRNVPEALRLPVRDPKSNEALFREIRDSQRRKLRGELDFLWRGKTPNRVYGGHSVPTTYQPKDLMRKVA
jgi:hypothetical protein